MMTKENTLYLPIKQVYFDQIIDGSKKEEYREVKGTTAGKYLMKDENGAFVRNPECTQPDKDYYIEDYNGGNFPFLPRQYKYLSMAVGYAKERDTAVVEITHVTFQPTRVFNDKITFWICVFHLGKVIELHRKKRS